MKKAAAALLIFILIASCERRLFLEKIPEIVFLDGRYIFDPNGIDFEKVMLISGNSVIELSSCRENDDAPEVFYNSNPGYFDLYLINGTDTALVNNCYVGKPSPEHLRITVLDVAQGDCFIIYPPDERPSVVDGGYGSYGTYSWQGGGSKALVKKLESGGHFDLKYLVETHSHKDHYGGLYDVKNDGAFSYGEYISYASGLPAAGDTLFISPTVKAVVINGGLIGGDENTSENDRSAAFKLIYKDFGMIFTGDIQSAAEAAILGSGLVCPSEQHEILKAAHHGSSSSSSSEFLNAVMPLYSVICSGAGNPYGHPTASVVERIMSFGSAVLRTDINGTVGIFTDGRTFQVSYTVP